MEGLSRLSFSCTDDAYFSPHRIGTVLAILKKNISLNKETRKRSMRLLESLPPSRLEGQPAVVHLVMMFQLEPQHPLPSQTKHPRDNNYIIISIQLTTLCRITCGGYVVYTNMCYLVICMVLAM